MSNMMDFMSGARRYRVMSNITVVRTGGAVDVRLNRGQLVPADVPQRDIEHMLAVNQIVEVEPTEASS